jgi:hypothetical protein
VRLTPVSGVLGESLPDRSAKSSLFWVVPNIRPFLKFTGRNDLVDALNLAGIKRFHAMVPILPMPTRRWLFALVRRGWSARGTPQSLCRCVVVSLCNGCSTPQREIDNIASTVPSPKCQPDKLRPIGCPAPTLQNDHHHFCASAMYRTHFGCWGREAVNRKVLGGGDFGARSRAAVGTLNLSTR